MKKNSTPLVDEHLQAFQEMQEAGTDDFFYTRLKARIQKDNSEQGWSLPLKPVWIIGTLILFLAMNGFMLIQNTKTQKSDSATSVTAVQSFAKSYDQSISSY